MKNKRRFGCVFVLLLLLLLIPTDAVPSSKHEKPDKAAQDQSKKVVYVCACLKNKSCSCMTEAKMEGPCACGTQGGPPLKAVPPDSDWARQNRDELAK